jgi:hypothetical protein
MTVSSEMGLPFAWAITFCTNESNPVKRTAPSLTSAAIPTEKSPDPIATTWMDVAFFIADFHGALIPHTAGGQNLAFMRSAARLCEPFPSRGAPSRRLFREPLH